MSNTINLSLEQVFDSANSALLNQGFSAKQAEAIAKTVTNAERDECHSHGLFRIPFYISALSIEGVDAHAVPVIKKDDSAIVHVDGGRGFCPLALAMGIEHLSTTAKQHGIAAMAIHNVYNIAALWPEVEELAQRGLVAFAFTAANAFVAPAGGTQPLFGTNPMAFAWPRDNQPPLVFDQASSTSARGEIQLHLRDGKRIPEGWAIDKEGNSTTDPEEALAGAQLPFGGHKGSSIALMIELLAGALIGDLFSYESSKHDKSNIGAPFGGEFLIAIEPTRCVVDRDRQNQQRRAEMLFEKILEQEGTRLPSGRRFSARLRTAEQGVTVQSDLHNKILAYAD